MMENWTPFASTVGGILIGLSASLMLILHGRITGISGILGQVLNTGDPKGEGSWGLWFLAGLIAGGVPFALWLPSHFEIGIERSTLALVVAGLLVGFGTRLGSGCTSGHGVCGISRLSPRSLAATAVFIATGALTVFAVRIFFGGVL